LAGKTSMDDAYIGWLSPEEFDKSYKRIDCDFISQGLKCSGWLCLPDGVSQPPVVVMAHGFSGLKEWLLDYTAKFLQRGIAVYLFDYRCWNGSEGEPRQWTSVSGQLRDWQEAIAHVRSLEEVKGSKLAIWGSSYSGGYVVKLAARDPQISAIIAQVPAVDAWASIGCIPLKNALKVVKASLKDGVRWLLGRSPYYIPVYAEPWEDLAVLQSPGITKLFGGIIPPWSDWRNEVAARSMLETLGYRPVLSAHKVGCPALFIASRQDAFISYKSVEKTASRMARAELVTVDMDHFEVYTGEPLERLSSMMADFLEKHLT
jgi:pimeloyl-ACP methyl ester carboxylesterase